MAERVSTGGTKTFHYQKGHAPKLDEKEKNEIAQAYERYYERKTHEKKKNKAMITIIIILIILIILTAIFLKIS